MDKKQEQDNDRMTFKSLKERLLKILRQNLFDNEQKRKGEMREENYEYYEYEAIWNSLMRWTKNRKTVITKFEKNEQEAYLDFFVRLLLPFIFYFVVLVYLFSLLFL